MPVTKNDQKRFTDEVRRIAKEQEITKTQAVLFYCTQKGLDPVGIAKLISPALREQIAAEAKSLHLLKTRKRRKSLV